MPSRRSKDEKLAFRCCQYPMCCIEWSATHWVVTWYDIFELIMLDLRRESGAGATFAGA